MCPQTLRAVRHFMHVNLHTWITVDAGDVCTWLITVILVTGRTWRSQIWAPWRDKNGTASGTYLEHCFTTHHSNITLNLYTFAGLRENVFPQKLFTFLRCIFLSSLQWSYWYFLLNMKFKIVNFSSLYFDLSHDYVIYEKKFWRRQIGGYHHKTIIF